MTCRNRGTGCSAGMRRYVDDISTKMDSVFQIEEEDSIKDVLSCLHCVTDSANETAYGGSLLKVQEQTNRTNMAIVTSGQSLVRVHVPQ